MIDFSEILNYADSLPERLQKGLAIAGNNLLSQQLARIHEDGLDSSGNKIGDYSTKPYFTSADRFVNKSGIPADQRGKKWVQLPEGYKSFRQYSGRQTAYIDLDYSGVMRQSYRVEVENLAFKLGYFGGSGSTDGVTASEKMAYAEKRNGSAIAAPTKEEEAGIIEDILTELAL